MYFPDISTEYCNEVYYSTLFLALDDIPHYAESNLPNNMKSISCNMFKRR